MFSVGGILHSKEVLVFLAFYFILFIHQIVYGEAPISDEVNR